ISGGGTPAFFTAFPPPTTNVINTINVTQTLGLLGVPSTPFGLFSGLPGTTPAFNLVAFNVPTDIGGGLPPDSPFTISSADYTLSDPRLVFGRVACTTRRIF